MGQAQLGYTWYIDHPILRACLVVQAWFSHDSGSAYARSDPINCRRRVARIMVKCESAVVQAWFRCGSAMVQARPWKARLNYLLASSSQRIGHM